MSYQCWRVFNNWGLDTYNMVYLHNNYIIKWPSSVCLEFLKYNLVTWKFLQYEVE